MALQSYLLLISTFLQSGEATRINLDTQFPTQLGADVTEDTAGLLRSAAGLDAPEIREAEDSQESLEEIPISAPPKESSLAAALTADTLVAAAGFPYPTQQIWNRRIVFDTSYYWLGSIVGNIFAFLIGYAFYCKVYGKKPTVAPHSTPANRVLTHDFTEGFFDCFNDTDTCVHSCCHFTRGPRVADTYVTAGLISPASACPIAAIIAFCPVLHFLFMPCKRAELRERLGGKAGVGCLDVLAVCCCLCCLIAQEARQVDRAIGVKTTFCCNLWQVDRNGDMPIGYPICVSSTPLLMADTDPLKCDQANKALQIPSGPIV